MRVAAGALFDTTYPLAPANWKPLAAKDPSKGWKYTKGIPIRKVLVKAGKQIKIVGKGQNSFNYAINLAQSQLTNLSAAESRIRDADLAAEALLVLDAPRGQEHLHGHAPLEELRSAQVVVGSPLEVFAAGERDRPVEVRRGADVVLVAQVTHTRVARGVRPADRLG